MLARFTVIFCIYSRISEVLIYFVINIIKSINVLFVCIGRKNYCECGMFATRCSTGCSGTFHVNFVASVWRSGVCAVDAGTATGSTTFTLSVDVMASVVAGTLMSLAVVLSASVLPKG